MKLATLKDNHRDGKLLVVSKDLSRAILVTHIAKTLQSALENWEACKDELETYYQKLNEGYLKDSFAFDQQAIAAPLPRAYQWADGSAYVNHVELVRKARGQSLPENFWHDPLIYQGGSDTFLGPYDPILLRDESWGLDFEAEIAVITKDVPLGCNQKEAKEAICLLMLVNDISLRELIPDELAKGFGFFHGKPSSAFSPVAVTPDELQGAFDGSKVHLPLVTHFNGKLFGEPNAGIDMTFDFPTLIMHAAKTRQLSAGTIIGSGTVSNYDKQKGSSCIVEKRMLEIIESGSPKTLFMKQGDRVRIEMFLENQQSIFGAIDQEVMRYP